MTEAIRNYLLSVSATAILLVTAQSVLPDGAVRKVVGYAGSLILLLVVLSPIAKLDSDRIARTLSRFQVETEFLETGVQTGNRELLAEVISKRCETYILDKARALGIVLHAEIELQETADYPYPVGVKLTGRVNAVQKEALSADISENLGIPENRQEWSID